MVEFRGSKKMIKDGVSNYKLIKKDEISFYAVDNNYQTSTIQINKPGDQILQVFYIPTTLGIEFVNAKSTTHTHVQPPGKFIASAVSLPDICVFLI